MSAFFVQYGAVDDVVAVFMEMEPARWEPDSLGRALLHMNAEAMRQRYPSIVKTFNGEARSEYEEYVAQANAYHIGEPSEDPKQRANSCACLSYQCSEGNVPETNPLYRDLTELAKAMERKHGRSGTWDRAR